MQVNVFVELEPGHERRGFAGSIRSKVFELPVCPGPGWWLSLEDEDAEFVVHSAGVSLEGCWCSVRTSDIERFTEEDGWS